MPIRFHLDEHVDPAIAFALRRRNIDVTTTTDANLLSADDSVHLEYARQSERVIFTQDEDFLTLAASGAEHAGIIYNKPGRRTLGQIIEFLELVFVCLNEDEMKNHVEFL